MRDRNHGLLLAALVALTALTVGAACTDREPAALPGVAPVTAAANAPGTVEPLADSGPAPFQTLPPVAQFAYPMGPTDIVVQISVDDEGLDVPLLTVYGGLDVVASTDDGWRIGTITDFTVQEFLGEAASVGLLDGPLSLRGPDSAQPPQIVVRLDVDGVALTHEFDLSAIERPPALRRFLQEAVTSNPFELTTSFDPGTWITCEVADTTATAPIAATAARRCSVVTEPLTPNDRPLLPHEPDPDALLP